MPKTRHSSTFKSVARSSQCLLARIIRIRAFVFFADAVRWDESDSTIHGSAFHTRPLPRSRRWYCDCQGDRRHRGRPAYPRAPSAAFRRQGFRRRVRHSTLDRRREPACEIRATPWGSQRSVVPKNSTAKFGHSADQVPRFRTETTTHDPFAAFNLRRYPMPPQTKPRRIIEGRGRGQPG